jgi:hypothetical protein
MSINFHTFDISFFKITKPILTKLGQKGRWLSSLCVRQVWSLSNITAIGEKGNIYF